MNKIKILKRLLIFLLSLALISVLVVFFFFYFLLSDFSYSIHRAKEFNRELWLEQEKVYHPEPGRYRSLDCTRGRMYDDLHKNHLKFLMKFEEIEALLGHSTVERRYDRGFKKWSHCFQYLMGSCHKGPPCLLVFCNIPGTSWYKHYYTSQGDSGYEIKEDKEEIRQYIKNNRGETEKTVILKALKKMGFNVDASWLIDKRTTRNLDLNK